MRIKMFLCMGIEQTFKVPCSYHLRIHFHTHLSLLTLKLEFYLRFAFSCLCASDLYTEQARSSVKLKTLEVVALDK